MLSSQIQAAIDEAEGKFLTVYIVKADKSLRMMNCRTGVSKYTNGGKQRGVDSEQDNVTVWDAIKKQYRRFKKARVFMIAIQGQKHLIEDFDKSQIIDQDAYVDILNKALPAESYTLSPDVPSEVHAVLIPAQVETEKVNIENKSL